MPLTQTRANGSARGYGFASVKLGGGSYYVAYYDTTSGAVIANNSNGVALGSDNSLYYAGDSSSFPKVQKAIKVDPTGTVSFQKTFNSAGEDSTAGPVVIDSSGNFYEGISCNIVSGGCTWAILKSNSSGGSATITGKQVNRYNVAASSVFFDSSSNTYLYGYTGQYPAAASCGWMKFNTSMSVVDTAYLYFSGSSNAYAGANIDSSGNLYCAGYVYVSGTPQLFLVKTTSSAVSWSYSFSYGGSSTTSSIGQLPIDSSGNLYLFGASGSTGLISKINSSGTAVWTKTLTNGATFIPSAARIDPSGSYLYLSVYCGASGSEKNRVIKMDTSGNLVWERQFYTTSGTNTAFFGCDVNSNCYAIVATATVSSVGKTIMGVFPTDGTKTGTYSVGGVSLVYDTPGTATTVGSTTLTRSSLTASVQPITGTNGSNTVTTATPTQTFTSTAL